MALLGNKNRLVQPMRFHRLIQLGEYARTTPRTPGDNLAAEYDSMMPRYGTFNTAILNDLGQKALDGCRRFAGHEERQRFLTRKGMTLMWEQAHPSRAKYMEHPSWDKVKFQMDNLPYLLDYLQELGVQVRSRLNGVKFYLYLS